MVDRCGCRCRGDPRRLAIRVARDDRGQRVMAGGEWANFDAAPLSPRAFPLIAWTGREAVIFGGSQVPGDGKVVHVLDDGGVYDPVEGAWRPMAEPPFEPPLAGPVGTWTGSELLVVGIPCKDLPVEDSSLWNCSPGGLRAGAFDPVENAWREVDLPASLGRDAHHRSIQAIGSTSQGSLFVLDGRYWLARGDDRWAELPSPPIKARSLCLVGDRLLALDYTDDVTYEDQLNAQEQAGGEVTQADPTPPDQQSAMMAATLDLPGGSWETIPRRDTRGIAPPYLNSTCAPDGAYVFSAGASDDPATAYAHCDAITGEWEPIPPPAGRPNVSPPSAFVGGQLVIWGDSLLQYDPKTNRWAERSGIQPPTVVVPADERALLYHFPVGDRPTTQFDTFAP